MIRYVLKQCKNAKQAIYGKLFAYPVIEETIDEEALSAHMASHNTPFSQGAIKGMLTDMVQCIHELLLEGKNVKLTNLAIFSIGIKNAKGGAEDEEDFSVQKNIQGVKLRARATGIMIAKGLKLNATLKKAVALTNLSAVSGTPTGSNTGSGTGSNTGSNTGDNTGGGGNGGDTGNGPQI
ncbi:MAG: DNA-binding protein [Bacteroidaceae bacterium]|nr:DNA-binding protein [Bacteroidaceae bacterium]